jgi:hypothetical protein
LPPEAGLASVLSAEVHSAHPEVVLHPDQVPVVVMQVPVLVLANL